MYYWVDDGLVPAEEATVSVRDRGFRYGDAAFETVRAYGGTPFAWDAHADRLQATCETLGFSEAVPGPETLRERVETTLAANDLADAYVRLSVTRGIQPGKLTPREAVDPTVVVEVDGLPRGGSEGTPVYDGPATVETVPVQRVPDAAIPSGTKTHNYLNGILARLAARDADADEVLLPDADGRLTEGATSNLFFASEGVLRTPSADLPLLPGVTRGTVLDLAREAGLAVETGHYDVEAVRAAEEAFLTNSTWELRPVATVDGVPVGGGPVTDRLQAAFDALVEERCYR